jgi:hypothetical protein
MRSGRRLVTVKGGPPLTPYPPVKKILTGDNRGNRERPLRLQSAVKIQFLFCAFCAFSRLKLWLDIFIAADVADFTDEHPKFCGGWATIRSVICVDLHHLRL